MRAILLVMLLVTSKISAQITELDVIGKIEGGKDVSAISCIKDKLCLLASDETNFLQAFKIVGSNLEVIGKKIDLGKFKKENDIEALTHDGKYFYAVGSHGLSRKSGKYQESRYNLFKILLNKRAEVIEISTLPLAPILRGHEKLGKYYKRRLQNNGINIEGMAYHRGRLYFGFRAPLILGNAQILSLKLDDFSLSSSNLYSLDMQGQGIRSLEFFNNKLYGILGASLPSDFQTSNLVLIDLIYGKTIYNSVPHDYLKLEGLEVLGEDEMFFVYDSVENGKPIISK